MAKIFKTISLEERWKASKYSQGPQKPGDVDQGSTNLKEPRLMADYLPEQLKTQPDPQQQNAAILKQTLEQPPFVLPTIAKLDEKPLSEYARPLTNTKFRTSISLENRLDQTNLGTTNFLPQYFLADFYTDYITITPFGIFNHTSDVDIQPFNFAPQQGGTDPNIITFDPALSQGLIFIGGLNNTYISFVNIQIPAYDNLLLQGTYFTNGTYYSFTAPGFVQGADAHISFPSLIFTVPTSTQSMTLLQGIYLTGFNTLQSVVPITLSPAASQIANIPTNILITNSGPTPFQGAVTILPITFQPIRTSPILNVLGYEAQRALAFFTPRVIHGSTDLSGASFGQDFVPNQGENSQYGRLSTLSLDTTGRSEPVIALLNNGNAKRIRTRKATRKVTKLVLKKPDGATPTPPPSPQPPTSDPPPIKYVDYTDSVEGTSDLDKAIDQLNTPPDPDPEFDGGGGRPLPPGFTSLSQF